MNALAAPLAKLPGASMYGFASEGYACQGQCVDYIVLSVPGGYSRMGARCAQNQGVDCLFPALDLESAHLDFPDDWYHVDRLVAPLAPTAPQDERYHKVAVLQDVCYHKVCAPPDERCHKVCAPPDEHCHKVAVRQGESCRKVADLCCLD
jgi:hypothetical protein